MIKLYGIIWGKCSHALQSEAMINTKYEDMPDKYKCFWLMNKLKLLCAVVDSYINKCYSAFNTLKDFYMICQHIGETVTNYFDRF